MSEEYNLSDIKIPLSGSWQALSWKLPVSLPLEEVGKSGCLKDCIGMTRCHCDHDVCPEGFMQETGSGGLTEQTKPRSPYQH